MFTTIATDLVLKRQQYFIMLVDQLTEHVQYTVVMQKFDDRERIVNKDGKVISRWR